MQPSQPDNPPVVASWGLTALAGCVDALVVARGVEILPVYVTGDTTKLANRLVGDRWADVWPFALLIVTFLAGSTLAAWLAGKNGRHAALPLLLTGFLLLLGLLLAGKSWSLPTVLATAAAMGAANQVLAKDPGVTFVTGALVRAARALAGGKVREAGKNLLRWLALLLGAAAGALLDVALNVNALAIPASAAILAGLAVLLWPRPLP